MLHNLNFWFFCLFAYSFLSADESRPLTVDLATESPLSPLYLLPFYSEQSELGDAYIRQLERILTFDLNHNGSTMTLKRTPENDRLSLGRACGGLGSAFDWKERGIFYVVKVTVEGSMLTASVLDVCKQSVKNAHPSPLTGNLSEDRRQIHALADAIYRALFGREGIASTKLLYTMKLDNSSDSNRWISEVWECDYDGGNARKVTQERAYCVTPTYIPPKPGYTVGGFLYVSYRLGQPKIYAAPLKEGKSSRLSYLGGNQLMPAISRQRDKIAFICDVTGNPDLFLQPFNLEKGAVGKPQQIFSAPNATQGSPTFSPDGTRLAFVSNKDGSPKIYVMNIPEAGTPLKHIKATLISKRNRENSAPAWSPDGTKLAYCARTKNDRQIWIYDFATGRETPLTEGPGHKENPSWGPDNLHLVFNSSSSKGGELFIIDLNQAEATQITFGSHTKCFPSWEPR